MDSDLVYLGGERPHLCCEVRQSVVRGNLRDDAAHRDDRALKLLQRSRILTVTRDFVDLLRNDFEFVVEAGEILRRRQSAQRIAHLDQSALDARERRAVAGSLPGLLDAIGELAHLAFESFHRFAGHCVLQHDADLSEIVAQHLNCLVDSAGPVQHLDLLVDLPKLLFEAGKLLRVSARQRGGLKRRLFGRARQSGSGRRVVVERSLAIRDLLERLLQRGRHRVGRRVWARLIYSQVCDPVRMLLGLAFGGAAFGRQLIQPAVDLGNHFDKLARGFIRAARRRLRWRGAGVPPRHRFELTREIVEAAIDAGQAVVGDLAGRVIAAAFALGPRLVLLQLSGQAVERAAAKALGGTGWR